MECEDSKKGIMEATYKALCKHGYADLSIEKISRECDKGKSLIYYHFDSKRDLMQSFLEYLIDEVERIIDEMKDYNREEQLDRLLDAGLAVDDEMWNFRKALFEIRSQAPYREGFAEKLGRIEGLMERHLCEILRDMEIDGPDRKARVLISAMEGTVSRRLSSGNRKDIGKEKDLLKEVVINGS
ncbi:MAG: TetR/AcrR family transcriptional regulator [Candidatus Aenigmatarchaeota archaeon]